MSAPPAMGLLLSDALYQTAINPTASYRWHELLRLFAEESDDAVRAHALAYLQRQIPDHGEAGFLLATFLADVTGKIEFAIRAGELVHSIAPCDCTRLMAFAVYQWGHQVARSGSNTALVEALCRIGLPAIIRLMGQQFITRHGQSDCFPLALPALPATAERRQRATNRPVSKVAVLAPVISSDNHPPTWMALVQAQLLRNAGMEVAMFSAQEYRIPNMGQYLGNNGTLFMSALDMTPLQPFLPKGVNLTVADDQFSLMRRWHDVAHAIDAFDPDLVLFVGLFSPLMDILYQRYPCLGLCIHATAPMAPVDVWLCSHAALANQATRLWGPALPPAIAHPHPFRIHLKPRTRHLTRADAGLPPDKLILLTVGSRLPDEIHGAFAERMVALLQSCPDVCWLLAGGKGTLPAPLCTVNPEQRILFPHREDLRSIVPLCDVYVNPDRIGGGFSAAEAMADGLPVLALVGSDSGDKAGPDAMPDLDHYFDRLHALLASRDLRLAMGSAARARFQSTLDLAQSTPSLLAACERAQQLFAERMAGQ